MIISSEDGRINLVNSQVEMMFGFRREELIGRDMSAAGSRVGPAARSRLRLRWNWWAAPGTTSSFRSKSA